jgi:hypothetical protein
MTKIRRNQQCPCGSNLKYKKCCGSFAVRSPFNDPEHERAFHQARRRVEAQRLQREKQQGLGKGIISAALHDHRIVAVGNTVHTSKAWRTFQDFLRYFLVEQLGREWFVAEQAKSIDSERHPIVRWYEQALADTRRLGKKVGEVYVGPMTGAQRAFINLAYNIYLIAHHAEAKESAALVASFAGRLKSERADDFVGKLFETYAAAAFLKAGFELAYENEADGRSSHVEFVATFPATKKKFSVEVKTRNRSVAEDGPVDEIKRLRVGSKLNKALTKTAAHTRVVMIEVNIPDASTEDFRTGWARAALDQIRTVEKLPQPDGSPKPSTYVVVTNHAFHNNLGSVGVGTQVLVAGCQIPDFGPDVPFNRLKDVLESAKRHREMFALIDSMRDHYEIPSTFDGENPALQFEGPDAPARLTFGEVYLIPDQDGKEIPARLRDGIVQEAERTALGVYETMDGHRVMVATPLTEAEMGAWKAHPETFFGEVRKLPKKAKNWLELAKFFYESYKSTDREKLLEWMKTADDFEHLKMLSQEELAIVYCERLGWGAEVKKSA